MDSKNWSHDRKANAARKFGSRLKALQESYEFRAEKRRIQAAACMSIAIAEKNLARAEVAKKAAMKTSLLSRQLSGEVNLTLDSIGKICEAAGFDFDIVLREPGSKQARQPWEGILYTSSARVHLVAIPSERASTRQRLSSLKTNEYIDFPENSFKNPENDRMAA